MEPENTFSDESDVLAEVKLCLEWGQDTRVILICGDETSRDEVKKLPEISGREWVEYPACEIEAASHALTNVHDGRGYASPVLFWFTGPLSALTLRCPNIVQRLLHVEVPSAPVRSGAPSLPAAGPKCIL